MEVRGDESWMKMNLRRKENTKKINYEGEGEAVFQ